MPLVRPAEALRKALTVHQTIAVIIAAGLVLFLRRPEAILSAEFYTEEGSAFYAPTHFYGPELLFEPWAGYLQLAARAGYEVLRLVPVFWVPLAENVLAYSITIGVTVFAARRFGPPALIILLLPAASTLYPTLVNAQWFIALWLVVIAATPTSRQLELIAAVVAAVSVGFALLLAPIFAAKRRWIPAVILALGGMLQVALAFGARGGTSLEWELIPAIALLRLVVVPVLGDRVTSSLQEGSPDVLLLAALAIAVPLAILLVRAWAQAWPLFVVAFAVAAAGVTATGWTGDLWRLDFGQRYFFLSGVAVATAILMGLGRRDKIAVPLSIALAVGIAGDLRLPPHPSFGWPTRYTCIGSQDPCTVPVYPERWTIHWPGHDGVYEMPEADF